MAQLMFSRRELIGIASAAVFAPQALTGATRNITWAMGAVTWVVRAGNRTVKWAEILPDIRDAGFEGFEAYTTPTLPVNDENMNDLEKLAPQYKLRMSAIYWETDWHDPSKHEFILKDCHRFYGYLKRFGANRLVIGPPEPNGNEKQCISNMAKIVTAVAKIGVEQYSMKTGIHPHINSLVENPRQVDQLLGETDPKYFSFAPDTSQLWMGGGDPVRIIEKYKERVIYLHYKDCHGYYRDVKNYMEYETELGRGVVDFPAIHRILKSIGYKGWITIDIGIARVSPLETGKVCRAYIDRVLNPIYA